MLTEVVQAVDAILDVEPGEMTPDAKTRLKNLNRHFNPPRPRGGHVVRGGGGGGEGGEDQQAPDQDLTEAAEKTRPWQRFHKLTEIDMLPGLGILAGIDQQRQGKQETDVIIFLGLHATHDAFINEKVERLQQKTGLVEGLRLRIDYSFHVEVGSDFFRSRELFTYLMWYDFVHYLCPNVRGSRLGRKTRADIETALRKLLAGSKWEEEDQLKRSVDMVAEFCRYGMRLNKLCEGVGDGNEPLGNGCLFMFVKQLSRDL